MKPTFDPLDKVARLGRELRIQLKDTELDSDSIVLTIERLVDAKIEKAIQKLISENSELI